MTTFCIQWLPQLGVAAIFFRVMIWLLLKLKETKTTLAVVSVVSAAWFVFSLLWLLGMFGFMWYTSDAVRAACEIYRTGGAY